jgi:gamma-glutamyltranspeptidase/glutathione hydrolase
MTKGAVACGHPATAEAAREILDEGGNAFDAVLAAVAMAAVAEPVLCSLGGGGFLLAARESGETELFDFFVSTPFQRRPPEELSFYPVLADFGPATQEFHIGLGAMTAPAAIKGLLDCHAALARLPLARILAPAARGARQGVPLSKMQAFIHSVVAPILTDHAESRALFCRPDGALKGEGELLVNPDLADAYERLAREGARPLIEGDWGDALLALAREEGGHLTAEDLSRMATVRRRPLRLTYRDVVVDSNPAPSSGGVLILLTLLLLAERAPEAFASVEELRRLAQAMALANTARRASGLAAAEDEAGVLAAAENMLGEDFLSELKRAMNAPQMTRGTTHISVADAEGNLAALTISNGEGCARVLPGTGILLNNMLGEEDLNPRGFNNWTPGARLGSMMAPSLARFADGRAVALGSGGSNRIRTAILQVLVNLIDHGMSLEQAIQAPRIHVEGGVAHGEEGLPVESLGELAEQTKNWPYGNLFFGGAHGVERNGDGAFSAFGDPRRGGVGFTL